MYEMMCGRLPFYSRDHEKLFEMILMKVCSVQELTRLCITAVTGISFRIFVRDGILSVADYYSTLMDVVVLVVVVAIFTIG